MQIAVEDDVELRTSIGELEDAGFTAEVFDATGREVARRDLIAPDGQSTPLTEAASLRG